VLVNDDFQPRRRDGPNEVQELIAVQIVGRSDPRGAFLAEQPGSQLIGSVQ
jgi:hypothetical protein